MQQKPTINHRDPKKYIQTRLKMLYNEKRANNDRISDLVLDKSIYELTVVLSLLD